MENNKKIRLLIDYGNSGEYEALKKDLADKAEELKAQIIESQTKTAIDREDPIKTVKFSDLDKVVWLLNFLDSIDTGETEGAKLFKEYLKDKAGRATTHLFFKMQSDFPILTETDKLRYYLNYTLSFIEPAKEAPEGTVRFGGELDALIAELEKPVEEEKKDEHNPYDNGRPKTDEEMVDV